MDTVWKSYIEGKNGELTDNEILTLAEKSGSFDFLNDKEEDIYTRFDGQKINVIVENGN